MRGVSLKTRRPVRRLCQSRQEEVHLRMVPGVGGEGMDVRNPQEGKPSECNDQWDEEGEEGRKIKADIL